MNGEPPVIYGDGTQTQNLTYIEDIIEANRRLLNTDAADGEILNIGSTDNIEIVELAKVIRDQIDPDLPLEHTERHEADAEHTHADVSKASEVIGYDPDHTIHQEIKKFVAWYADNKE